MKPHSTRIAALVTLIMTTALTANARTHHPRHNGTGPGPGPCKTQATRPEWQIMLPESNGWPTANNPHSTAFGCFQALRSTRLRFNPPGCPTDTTNTDCQMASGRAYIRARYGTAQHALAIRRTRGWY